MIFSKREKISFYFISALLYFLAWIIQSQMLIKGDVSWQMHLARSVLNGGNYIKDFFEINPPLSIFLYMPEIFIEKILFVSHIIGLRIYMFLCATGSLLICYVLIKKLFVQYDTKIAFIFLLSLIFIDLILPLNEFGQRENLLVILTMPYFLLAACRVNKIKINLFFAIFIGLLAALGFGLKPFFLIAFILVEGYVAFKTNIKNMFRPENMGIVLFLLLYFFVILLFFTSYLTVVTPVALRFYYQLFSKPIKICLLLLPVYFCFFTFIFYYIQHKKNAYDALSSVLALALLGFFIAYLIQRIPWYY
ncbi:MAG: putative membrane spanning protein, partial [uncultured bacterium]